MTDEQNAQAVVPQPAAKPATAEPTDPSAVAAALMADQDGPYWNPDHRQHRATVDKVGELLTAVHGDGSAILEDGSTSSFHDVVGEALAPPATPEGYDWHVELAEGQEYDTEADAAARDWFHSADIPNAEAQSLVNQYQTVVRLDEDQREAMKGATLNSLHRSWGANFDDNLASVKAVAQSAGPEFIEMLENTGMGNSHQLFQTLLRVAKQREFKK